jgi:hypothetical protein
VSFWARSAGRRSRKPCSKPLRRAWPAVAARAKAEGGTIFGATRPACAPMTSLAAAMRPRAGHLRYRPTTSVTNKGELRWMVLNGTVKAPSLLRFLARLIKPPDQGC